MKGIDVNKTWEHLKSDHDISQQIAENTGLEPVEQRLDHCDTLPERIAHWLQTGQPPTTKPSPTPAPLPLAGANGNPPGGTPQLTGATSPADPCHAWAKDCIIEDPDAVTPTAWFVVSYTRWCHTKNIQPLPDTRLQQYLTRQYGPSEPARINGQVTRARRGIKLRTPAPVTGV